MAAKGHRKLSEAVRREIVSRYSEYKRNAPKRLMSEYGIAKDTLLSYVREAGQRA
jgi:hypothetical protein